MRHTDSYLMENPEEIPRLEKKTDPEAVRKQALWCGLKSGLRVLDAGCGPGLTTSILYEMIQPGGRILGVDYSEERIQHAKDNYGRKPGIDFRTHDLRDPLDNIGMFDLIWVRFVLEYNLVESPEIVRNLTACLKPGGYLCLLDLDHNCLNHYGLSTEMEKIVFAVMNRVEREYNFDPYSGRKLYAYLYDLGYQDIQMDLLAHHLFYGKIRDEDLFNWLKKIEVASVKAQEDCRRYAGGISAFLTDISSFLKDPRRFTYTPLIICKGRKVNSS